MTQILIACIKAYQIIISPLLRQVLGARSICRFTPSCSVYTVASLKKHGMIRGLQLSVKRLLRCQPFINTYGRTI